MEGVCKDATPGKMRRNVLGLYRRILSAARHWQSESSSEAQTAVERQYIKDEARRLFKKNKKVGGIKGTDDAWARTGT